MKFSGVAEQEYTILYGKSQLRYYALWKGQIMAAEKHSRKLDLSGVDVRVRCVLRKLGVETIEKLLSLTQAKLLTLKNCGSKTAAKIMRLQEEYGKEPSFIKDQQETMDKVLGRSRAYMNRLIVVAIAANEVVKSEQKNKNNRYYFHVTTKCFNVLMRALEALKKQ